MKLTVPGILITALIVASPVALAQNTGYSGTTSKPGASVAKDETNPTKMTKHSKKHTASYKHPAPCQGDEPSKSQTTGSGSTSCAGAGVKRTTRRRSRGNSCHYCFRQRKSRSNLRLFPLRATLPRVNARNAGTERLF